MIMPGRTPLTLVALARWRMQLDMWNSDPQPGS